MPVPCGSEADELSGGRLLFSIFLGVWAQAVSMTAAMIKMTGFFILHLPTSAGCGLLNKISAAPSAYGRICYYIDRQGAECDRGDRLFNSHR